MITVYGQIGDGPIMIRQVSIALFFASWGIWAAYILNAREDSPFVVGDRKVWVE